MDVRGHLCYNYGIRNAPARVNAGSVSQRSERPMTTPIVNPENPQLKRCCTCGDYLPCEAYGRDKSTPDGLARHCKTCKAAKRAQSRDSIRARNAIWRESHPEYAAEKSKQWRLNNPERRREYRKANSTKIIKDRQSWYAANPNYNREYRAANRERLSENDKAYYLKTKEHQLERSAQWYKENRTYHLDRNRMWRKNNPDRVKAMHQRRRARKLAAGGTFTPADLTAIRAAQTDKRGRLICWRCGKPIKGTPHLDHWIPLTKGGANDAGNLHYMHARCNLTKRAKLPTEIGRLI